MLDEVTARCSISDYNLLFEFPVMMNIVTC